MQTEGAFAARAANARTGDHMSATAIAIAITGITLRTRKVKGEERVEVVVHCAEDGEAWIAHSEPLRHMEHGITDSWVSAGGIRERPSRRCPLIGKAAMKKFEDAAIAAGDMKPRAEWTKGERKQRKATPPWRDTAAGKAWMEAHVKAVKRAMARRKKNKR